MYLYIENFTCPKENKTSLYFSVLKQIILSKQYETRYISTLVNSMDPDQLASLETSVDPGSTLFLMQDVSS